MTSRNLYNPLCSLMAGIICLVTVGSDVAVAQNVIRGTVPGWPGNTAYYAPQNVYQFAPAAPVVQAQYAPQAGQPTRAYYAPASASRIAYAVPAVGSYQISYAGAAQPGVSTTAFYGGYSAPVQRVAYMAPQVYYRPVPVQVPVTYYRPVTVYQPGMAAPTTCQFATSCTTTTCGTSRSSCWRPFAWLWGGSNNSCCKPQQTCNSSGCASQGCGAAPYYTVPPTIPMVPVNPAPAPGGFGLPSGVSPGTIITSPPTRSPGTIINSGPAANTQPRLAPGTVITPAPSNPNFNSGTPAPFNSGSGNFGAPVNPPAPVDPGFNDRFRPTLSDPYSQPAPLQSAPNSVTPPVMMTPPASSSPSIIGSGYRNEAPATFNDRTTLTQPENHRIGEPGLTPSNTPSLITPPPSVQPLADPHADERLQPNRAPQLITPGDRTAKADGRWAVVPAVWPMNANRLQPVRSTTIEPTHLQPVTATTETLVPVSSQVDDGGWKSAR
ncbi:hypothetical protein ETAA8_66660 [Anatilimnocola aggregata]|uniref:Uncharacterized protein n=1 Tax=Anatilimnocola aggregata TaxID=2528021 RepID=A0A517YMR2_9BACT|nr:hypothetical protein [Anatilimnocola aggregata]QDU31507.1 hypothetical protein ETAA8_66660 [Anatilimnocola aggregata]